MDFGDSVILDILEPSMEEWWREKFSPHREANGGSLFTPPQRKSIPLIHEGRNTLVAAPTGSGKTLCAFSSIINELFFEAKNGGLANEVYCLYVSPLKSLANDIHRNLEVPLQEVGEIARERGHEVAEIRHAIRHGDTPQRERQKMLDETPHILNTTPETLAILLNSPKFKEKLKNASWVVVDEVHALADNKRGTHLSVSLERLAEMKRREDREGFTRIGLSATVEPLERMGGFLVGEGRECEVVDERFVRSYDLEMICPAYDLVNTDAATINDSLYYKLHNLIQQHRNTLVFTNTRSGAERVLYKLRNRFPDFYDEGNSGCHHGSLGKEKRVEVEEKLKSGGIDFVTTSTSLELGIDMPHLDLVVQIGSPKSVSNLLQRVGRAGHSLDQEVKGRVFVMDRDELLEVAVMLREAERGFIDEVYVPERCLDVLCQHVYGMAINRRWQEGEAFRVLKRAYPYRDLSREEWFSVLRYLAADYEGLEEKNVYAKIWWDGESDEFGKRGLARPIYMQNIGTIPSSFSCDVHLRDDKQWVGDLDEEYLDKMEKGDVFILGGSRYEFRYRRGGKIYVDETDAPATIPRWFSERLPLSYDLALKIQEFKDEICEEIGRGDALGTMEELPIDGNSANSIVQMFNEQLTYAGEESVSTRDRLYVEVFREEGRRLYLVQSTFGRKFNDGFSRLMAKKLSDELGVDVKIGLSDAGFSLSIPGYKEGDLPEIAKGIETSRLESTMREALRGTELLKRVFRINAVRSLMILRRYKGREKSGRRQQMNSDMMVNYAMDKEDFAVSEETVREILYDRLEMERVKALIEGIQDGEVDVVQEERGSPSPLLFGVASLSATDAVLAEDRSRVIREFHRHVMQEISGTVGTGAES